MAWYLLRPLVDGWIGAARDRLGDDAFRREWTVGAGLRSGEALAYARSVLPLPPPGGEPPGA